MGPRSLAHEIPDQGQDAGRDELILLGKSTASLAERAKPLKAADTGFPGPESGAKLSDVARLAMQWRGDRQLLTLAYTKRVSRKSFARGACSPA
jgi:hypothetical protein